MNAQEAAQEIAAMRGGTWSPAEMRDVADTVQEAIDAARAKLIAEIKGRVYTTIVRCKPANVVNYEDIDAAEEATR